MWFRLYPLSKLFLLILSRVKSKLVFFLLFNDVIILRLAYDLKFKNGFCLIPVVYSLHTWWQEVIIYWKKFNLPFLVILKTQLLFWITSQSCHLITWLIIIKLKLLPHVCVRHLTCAVSVWLYVLCFLVECGYAMTWKSETSYASC